MSFLEITLESLLDIFHHTSIHHPVGRPKLVIIRPNFIIFSILVISLLTNPVSCDQYPIMLVFSIHNFCECVTGIFSLVTVEDITRDSGILDIITSSIHELPESPL